MKCMYSPGFASNTSGEWQYKTPPQHFRWLYPARQHSDIGNTCHLSNLPFAEPCVGRILLLQFLSHYVFLLDFMPFRKYNGTVNDSSQGAWRSGVLSGFWGQDLQLCAAFQGSRRPRTERQETWPQVWAPSAALRDKCTVPSPKVLSFSFWQRQ